MSFTHSCRDVALEADGSTLVAKCLMKDNKTYKNSRLSLDLLIGNIDGEFRWNFRDFSKSARNVTLEDGFLSGDLKDGDGDWVSSRMDLNAHIKNNNGHLEGLDAFLPTPPEDSLLEA